MIHLDLAGLVASTAGEIFSALEEGPAEIQVTEVRLGLPAVLEYVPAPAFGGLRLLGRLRVRPPSTYPVRRRRRPGRILLVWTQREEPAP
ncbi:MAG: hypothetical protein ACJ76J_30985 [Thermoanaerobaculia bacterium]